MCVCALFFVMLASCFACSGVKFGQKTVFFFFYKKICVVETVRSTVFTFIYNLYFLFFLPVIFYQYLYFL